MPSHSSGAHRNPQQERLSFSGEDGDLKAISPMLELGAYECLWEQRSTTFPRLAKRFRECPEALPSDFVESGRALRMARTVVDMLHSAAVERFDICVQGMFDYPPGLRDARNPVQLLYYAGFWDLVFSPSVAVVGTRKPTDEGVRRTRKLSHELVADGWTVVSGLARGVDTVAHETAIEAGGRTIGVLGTPLTATYPRENAALQKRIARDFLVISQVPVYRHSREDYRSNRSFFPQRNHTMAALTEATIIIEAGETSGTLVQARSALEQGRKLFILDSCFRTGLKWPEKLEKRGAVRVRDFDDIRSALPAHSN